MSWKILILLVLVILLKIPQKCYVKQSSSMQPWIENSHRQHQRKFGKKLRRLSPISYYSNTSAPQWTLLKGDIETNPGRKSTTNSRSTPTPNKQNSKKPTIKRKIAICSLCKKTVSVNAKLMVSTNCKIMIHSHSTNTRAKTISDTENAKEWTFFLCFNWTTYSQSERWIKYWCWKWWKYRNDHLEKLDQLNKHKRICHLNTQSISSTFSEFKIHDKPSKL